MPSIQMRETRLGEQVHRDPVGETDFARVEATHHMDPSIDKIQIDQIIMAAHVHCTIFAAAPQLVATLMIEDIWSWEMKLPSQVGT